MGRIIQRIKEQAKDRKWKFKIYTFDRNQPSLKNISNDQVWIKMKKKMKTHTLNEKLKAKWKEKYNITSKV